jgi:hypothetical protein
MVEGQHERNVLRSCIIGRTIAERLQLSEEPRSAHFYALLLKEAGCSSNTSKVTSHFSAENIGVKKNFNTAHWSLRRLTGGRADSR